MKKRSRVRFQAPAEPRELENDAHIPAEALESDPEDEDGNSSSGVDSSSSEEQQEQAQVCGGGVFSFFLHLQRLESTHFEHVTLQTAVHDFASAFESILSEPVKRDPIMSKNHGFAAEIKKRKLEVTVEKAYLQSRKALRNKWKEEPDPHLDIEKERILRKAATAGVVQLFNAINRQQQTVSKGAPVSASEKGARKFAEMSKSNFLSALKKAPAVAQKASWLQDDYDDNAEEADKYGGPMDMVNSEDAGD